VVRDYGWLLSSLGRSEEAAWLYRGEIARIGMDGEVDFWLNQLINLDGKGGVHVGWDEPLLWEWLAGQKKSFGQSAQSHLWSAYLGAKDAGAWKTFEAKARALAAEPCPAPLQYYFGYLLHHHGETAEGLKMMVPAWDRWGTNDYPDAYNVGPEVLGYLLAARDGKRAEQVLDRVLKDPVNGQDTRWLGEFAVRAADAGFREMAMRLWRARSALDLSDQRDLEKLASKGMAKDLRDFYAGLAKRAPGNEAIASALKKVGN
jgi:hypothetical protein